MTAPLVPDDAYDAALWRFMDDRAASGVPDDVLAVWRSATRAAVDAAAPLIVAAELRRLAETELEPVRAEMRETDDRTLRSSGMGEAIRLIRARAAELESGGSR